MYVPQLMESDHRVQEVDLLATYMAWDAYREHSEGYESIRQSVQLQGLRDPKLRGMGEAEEDEEDKDMGDNNDMEDTELVVPEDDSIQGIEEGRFPEEIPLVRKVLVDGEDQIWKRS